MNDEWDADLLHVTYNARKVTVKRMLERIAQEGFEAEVK